VTAAADADERVAQYQQQASADVEVRSVCVRMCAAFTCRDPQRRIASAIADADDRAAFARAEADAHSTELARMSAHADELRQLCARVETDRDQAITQVGERESAT
jgi:hypothetical protein